MKFIYLLAILVVIGSFATAYIYIMPKGEPTVAELQKLAIIRDRSQIEQTDKDLASPRQILAQSDQGKIVIPVKGKINIMTFQYLRCPDICHWESFVISYIVNKSIADGINDRIVIITIGVDPWRDTFEDVREYKEKWIGEYRDKVEWYWILDTPENMAKVWNTFKIVSVYNKDTGLVTHTAGFWIFDEEGRIQYQVVPTPNGWKDLGSLAKNLYNLIKVMAEK
jgi:cytochrome oxidase Cu insertion factor (SCO1/SenC/PrrC family)